MSSYRTLTNHAPVAQDLPPAFQFADLLRLIETRRSLILKVFLATVALAVVVALLLPTVWTSTAVVMLDSRKNNITDMSAVLSQTPSDPASIQNQIQILQSRELAARVAEQLDLIHDPEFNAAAAPPSLTAMLNPRNWANTEAPSLERQQDAVVDALQKHVSADAIGLSTTFNITVKASNPEKAARIANALARAYVGDQVATKVDAAQNTVQWLGNRVNNLAEQLQIQDAAIARYKAQHGLNDSGPGNSLVDQAMSGINGQIVQARSDLAEKQAEYDRITALERSGNAADISNVVASPLIIQLREQEATLHQQESDLATKYGPLHPKMQAVQAQKRELDGKIAEEVTRVAGSLSNDVMVAKAHLDSLTASLNGTERQASDQNMARVQLAAMESNATSTRAMYEAFVQRLRQAQDQDAVEAPESRVISAAVAPNAPSAPKRSLMVLASIPLGLLLGLLAALAAEKLGYAMPVRVNTAARTAWIAPAAPKGKAKKPKPAPTRAVWTGPPILAQISGATSLRAAEYIIDWPQSRFSHGVKALVHQLESRGDDGAVIAVTSALPGEGKSAIAVALARAAAQMGKKVVLIDCDPARLTSKALSAPLRAGVYDVLTGGVALNQALVKDPRSEAFLLGMPRRPANSATMFASQAMTRLIDVLRHGAELVVLDCGMAPTGPDAALLARHADATLLVSRQNNLQAPATASAARMLETAQAAPIGMVVLS